MPPENACLLNEQKEQKERRRHNRVERPKLAELRVYSGVCRDARDMLVVIKF